MAVDAAGVEVVLSGTDHDHERFAPLTPEGETDLAWNIREFVVGTGGADHYSFVLFVAIKPFSQAPVESEYGVLRLTLGATAYTWAFLSADSAGSRIIVSGEAVTTPATKDLT